MQNEKNTDQNFNCPMVKFVNLIAGKWAIPILYRLIITNGPIRFGELKRAISPITQKELTKQLRLFEQKGLISRKLYPEVPPKVEYQITELGKTLKPALNSIANWMKQHEQELR
ncbi:MAG: helix-turn-helix transcriptional regulator [Snodgrassella sp.]|jgi:DNA-binding HxlR family transcriptional regulator|uniref:HxlR family transcriptional regulator n=1 Tax=Snodgrassella alvi TaxID=1196083 RepID=A0A066TJ16_9NEIS|nr:MULTISPECIES: helix-turn-helix domain-containing protein [Snodgrassella]KDN12043.1 Transcriptional regulator, HxlR family [Snodgrassella communis]MCO6513652.1 helix-turn-helix transcriptional regulator [Snodgrassella sp.]MCO6515968.1 helix-turn-helix transcriptional regulator [Snodgrassella sp.]MCO6518731.1 helix-turn-helix transcriptional regulator [Snodgrassella sp.]MCO6519433.1 helix-turn-helix transcriptional regulator [Snodgrassella sp.]